MAMESVRFADTNNRIDAIVNAVDEYIRDGGGTYDELQAIVERAMESNAE